VRVLLHLEFGNPRLTRPLWERGCPRRGQPGSVELVQQTVKRYALLIRFHTIGTKKGRYPCLPKIARYASGGQRKVLIDITDA
jgi:hypothetical protein